ncbi:transglutaminase domain-containing protein [Filibacter tadaridae]|uniref:Protein-glutamine gamma-glutamyltransferase n=1 Tax=Filibacter tadaridae TaxID=2483811 RepID=A0A3P5WSN4_9BACL|nr:transglutaminase domain-containing protein [Filibacter tadaridae]VDC24232.1 Protein-glutamine gamma-glutamyltransferase [Filibacter tadaridae]
MNGPRMDRWLLAFLYVLAFVLLREWLVPVMELTDTNYLGLFLLFIALSFLLALLNAKWWISIPVKLLYVLWVIHYVFFGKAFFSVETINYLLQDLLSNISILLNRDWMDITNPLRTILFYALLWMTTYLIKYWIEYRKSIFLFYVMTVIFVAFIDTFSAYSADGSIFRIMLAGLLLLGLLSISRLAARHNVSVSRGIFATISIPLLFVIIAGGAFANVLPVLEPMWPDPVPYFKSLSEDAGEGGSGSGVSASGYDTDDSVLGGSFVQDNTLVFEAKVRDKQYWKIETKNTYTSKGWEQDSPTGAIAVQNVNEELKDLQTTTADTPRLEAQIMMKEKFPFILYPYGTRKVSADSDVFLSYSGSTGQYKTMNDDSEIELATYGIEFQEPVYSLKQLRDTSMDEFGTSSEDLSPYLQLPQQLPARVTELAHTITEEQDSVYEKTKAIERYFGRNGFTYAQQNIAIPGENDDYVDQFLFDTKRGYCDNFSTSMVVMLRSIDIPARWVKGFAPGEIKRNATGERVYQITNNEAHSWVEAYMPGIGWMPFEPTIGFSGQTDIDYDLDLDINDPATPEMKEKEQERKKNSQKKKPVKKETNFELDKLIKDVTTWIGNHVWYFVGAGAVVLFIGWRFYVARKKWLPKVLIRNYKSKKMDWGTFTKQYRSLLNQLDRIGFKRNDGQTLADFAIEVDNHFGGNNMRQLTSAYEKGLYGGDLVNHEWVALKEIWEDLIIRASG